MSEHGLYTKATDIDNSVESVGMLLCSEFSDHMELTPQQCQDNLDTAVKAMAMPLDKMAPYRSKEFFRATGQAQQFGLSSPCLSSEC